jgi:hypothetical protein
MIDFMWEEIYHFRPHLRMPTAPKRTAKYFAAREAVITTLFH